MESTVQEVCSRATKAKRERPVSLERAEEVSLTEVTSVRSAGPHQHSPGKSWGEGGRVRQGDSSLQRWSVGGTLSSWRGDYDGRPSEVWNASLDNREGVWGL